MVTIVKNLALNAGATASMTSTIDEPTAAANLPKVMMTGNWFAATSANSGANWAHVDPFTLFPTSVGGFCCDQIVEYDPGHQIWIWLLQYISAPAGE